MNIGDQVRTRFAFYGVPKGTKGIIVERYENGVTVGWDLTDRPYPMGTPPEEVAKLPAVDPACPLRDGFSTEEFKYLEVISDEQVRD